MSHSETGYNTLMPVTDKTRKILWGHSGNRCAICRIELVIDHTSCDDESVVGEECHLVSGKPKGPRYRPDLEAGVLDSVENLLLLCSAYHKLVDDQPETYTEKVLYKLKAN